VGKKRSDKQDKQDKQDKAPKGERRQELSEGAVSDGNGPRASLDLVLARLEEETAHTVDELVGQTRRDAAVLSAALQRLFTEAESSSRSAQDQLADRQARLTERFEVALAEVERHGLAMQALLAGTEDRYGEFLARLDTRVAEVVVQVAGLDQRLDDVVRQHEESISRVTARAIEGISVLEQAAAERGAFEEEARGDVRQPVERRRTEIARNGFGAQGALLRRDMTEQLDDALLASSSEAGQPAATVEQFVAEVQRASARIGALSVRAEAYSEIMRTKLEAIDRWFDGFVDRASGVSQLVADVPEFDDLVESHPEAGRRTAEVETQAEVPVGDDESSRTRASGTGPGARRTKQDDAEPEGT